MMNRIEFTKSIHYDNNVFAILNDFDQIMGLFDLINTKSSISNIYANTSNAQIIFDLETKNMNTANDIKDEINNNNVRKYNRTFEARVNQADNILQIELKDKVPE